MALLGRIYRFAILLLLGAGSVASAQEMEVPVSVQLPLFLKVMSFDRQLRARAGGEIVLGIAYQGGYRASADARRDASRAAAALTEVAGIPVTVVSIDLDREDLAHALARGKVTLLYVAPVRGIEVKDLTTASREAHVTTLSGVVRYVELGMAVGVRLVGDRPRIVVNLAASKLEGAELGAELLKLSEVR